jgi:hypothetical protein
MHVGILPRRDGRGKEQFADFISTFSPSDGRRDKTLDHPSGIEIRCGDVPSH